MELYHQILAGYLTVSQQFDNLIDAPSIVEGICYRTLCAIQEILKDPVLTDADCFQRIEQIVVLFEQLGGDAGPRHDFG